MAEVLSQSQIDALLHSMQNADAEESKVTQPQPTKTYRKYDFYSPKKYTKDKLKMLKSIKRNAFITAILLSVIAAMLACTVFAVSFSSVYYMRLPFKCERKPYFTLLIKYGFPLQIRRISPQQRSISCLSRRHSSRIFLSS